MLKSVIEVPVVNKNDLNLEHSTDEMAGEILSVEEYKNIKKNDEPNKDGHGYSKVSIFFVFLVHRA